MVNITPLSLVSGRAILIYILYPMDIYPDIIIIIIFTVPASRKFSVQICIILKHYITHQIHKLIGFQVFEWLSFGLICVFDS